MKRLAILTTAILVLSLGAALVIANQDAQSTTGTTASYSAPAANAVATEGGNVTENNVSSIASTGKWQGFYGNISGSLRLGDGVDVFYDWTGITFLAVYASPDNAVDWASVTGLNGAGALNGKDTDYGFTNTDSDSITNTFSGATCSAGTEIATAASVTPFNSSASAGDWEVCIAEDGGATVLDTVFGTNITSGDSYAGVPVDYQLMVPVNATGQTYYFYLEA